MKKVLLPLLMLMAISSFLLAVESAPSAIVGYVKYANLTGTNMIALPMENTQLTTEAVGIANPIINSMSVWDPINQFWSASDAYDDGAGGVIWDPILDTPNGTPLQINATADFNYYNMGTVPATNPVYPLEIGTNMLMVPLNRSDLLDTGLFGTAVPELNSISIWDNVNQFWSASDAYDDGAGGIIWDPMLPISIGTPMQVNSTVQFNWPAAAKSTVKSTVISNHNRNAKK